MMRMSLTLAFFLLASSLVHAQIDSSPTIEVDKGYFIQGHPYEINLGKQLWNTYLLAFDQNELKKTWPYNGYKLKNMKTKPCKSGSASENLTISKKIAFVPPSFYSSTQIKNSHQDLKYDFTGLKVGFAEHVGKGVSIRKICDWIRLPDKYLQNIANDFQTLQAISYIFSGSGKWSSSDVLPENAQPMMAGQLTTGTSDGPYAPLWNENNGSKQIAWKIIQSDGVDVPTLNDQAAIWKYESADDSAESHDIDYYVIYPDRDAVQTESTTIWESPGSGTFEWTANFASDEAADNLLSMWYVPPSKAPQLANVIGDEWYLLIDDLLPTLKADIRIERGALE